jgi:hypothetical protein
VLLLFQRRAIVEFTLTLATFRPGVEETDWPFECRSTPSRKCISLRKAALRLNVVDGMTLNLQVDSVTFRSLLGGTARITNRNLVTVSPAP